MEDSSYNKSKYSIFNVTEWPEDLVYIFTWYHDQGGSFQDRLCGSINKLLLWAFEARLFEFMVAPQPARTSAREFIVTETKAHRPVFIIEINDDSYVNNPLRRLEADVQIRERFMDMMPHCSLPVFFGLSMLGSSNTRLYRGNNKTDSITPTLVQCPSAGTALPADFLADEWAVDLLSPEGFKLMRDIVEYTLTHSAQLGKD